MTTATVTVDVDVDLSSFDDIDLIEELERRDIAFSESNEFITRAHEALKLGHDERALAMLREMVMQVKGCVL